MSPDVAGRAWFPRWIVMSFEIFVFGGVENLLLLEMAWLVVGGWVDMITPFYIPYLREHD